MYDEDFYDDFRGDDEKEWLDKILRGYLKEGGDEREIEDIPEQELYEIQREIGQIIKEGGYGIAR